MNSFSQEMKVDLFICRIVSLRGFAAVQQQRTGSDGLAPGEDVSIGHVLQPSGAGGRMAPAGGDPKGGRDHRTHHGTVARKELISHEFT